VASIRAVSESDDATWTQQQDWAAAVGDSTPGTADHLDIVFDLSNGMFNILNVNPNAIGNGLQLSGTQLLAKVSSGIQFDGSGNLVVKNGSGIAIDYAGHVTVNQGVGLQIDGSGFLTVKPSTGLAANSGGVYIPGGAITNSLLAALAIAQANIQSGAVGTSQIVTASITAALCQYAFITNALIGYAVIGTANIQNAAITNALISNLAVGTAQIQDLAVTNAKISSLDVTKLTAGTISATISISSPTITGGTIIGSNISVQSVNSGMTTTVAINPSDPINPLKISNTLGYAVSISGPNISFVDGSGGLSLTAGAITFSTGTQYFSLIPCSLQIYNSSGQASGMSATEVWTAQVVCTSVVIAGRSGATLSFRDGDGITRYVYGGAITA
jgi:hypothetical protein